MMKHSLLSSSAGIDLLVLLLLTADGFKPVGSVLQCNTGQYDTVRYNTIQYHTSHIITDITQNNIQHSRQPSILNYKKR